MADPDNFEQDGGNGVVRIATSASCRWTVTANAKWAAIEGQSQGEGPATLRVSVAPNDDELDRSLTFTVEGRTTTIKQTGQAECAYQVSPVKSSVPRDPWSGEISIATSRGCAWTASSDVPWLRVDQASGRGPASVTYRADFNTATGYGDQRTGVLAFRWRAPTAGQNVTLVMDRRTLTIVQQGR